MADRIRLGVYLEGQPYIGGAFQYNQSILEALDSLPKDIYHICVLYREHLWEKYLVKYDFELQYICFERWTNLFGGFIGRCLEYAGCDVANIKNIYAPCNRLSCIIDAQHLDLLICPSQEILPARVKTKCIVSIHDLMHRYENFPEVNGGCEYRSRDYRYRNICMAAVAIFVDSEVGKQQVLESYGTQYAEKVHVMPFAPPKYLFEKNNDSIKENDFDFPKKYIFYPAQFWQHKNHRNLILAVDTLRKECSDIQLILVGSPKNAYPAILKLIDEHNLKDCVHIMGYVSDGMMRYLYYHARAMIMPSFCGPTNIPPIEGLATGCPVAVARVYGMPEQVGDAGLTFDPNNVQELATVIRSLWQDDTLCKKLSQRGLARAKLFSQDAFNRRFEQVINHIFSGENF